MTYYNFYSISLKDDVDVPPAVVEAIISNALSRYTRKFLFLDQAKIQAVQASDIPVSMPQDDRSITSWNFLASISESKQQKLACEIFLEYVTDQHLSALRDVQLVLWDELTEIVKSIPADATYKDIGMVNKRDHMAYQCFSEFRREKYVMGYEVRAPFLNWLYMHPQREEIPFFRNWYGFKLPDIAKPIVEDNKYIDDMGLLGDFITRSQDGSSLLEGVNEPITPGSVAQKLRFILGGASQIEYAELLVVLRGRAIRDARTVAPVLTLDPEKVQVADRFGVEAEFGAVTNSAPRDLSPTGRTARKPSAPRLWHPPESDYS